MVEECSAQHTSVPTILRVINAQYSILPMKRAQNERVPVAARSRIGDWFLSTHWAADAEHQPSTLHNSSRAEAH